MSERRICKYCGMELSEDVPHGLRQCHLHAVTRITELESAQRWNPVSERLPEKKGYYMTAVIDGFDGSRSVEKFRYFGDGEFFAWSERYTVTHWMPLPNPPEEQQ